VCASRKLLAIFADFVKIMQRMRLCDAFLSQKFGKIFTFWVSHTLTPTLMGHGFGMEESTSISAACHPCGVKNVNIAPDIPQCWR